MADSTASILATIPPILATGVAVKLIGSVAPRRRKKKRKRRR